jgi:hypothetical protein
MAKKLADLTAWIHFVWVLIGIISLPLLFLIDWWYIVVLAFAGMNILAWIFYRGCLLLDLELKLRKHHNPAGSFEGRGFMEYYLKKIFNITITRSTIIISQRIYLAIMILIVLIQVF